MSVSRLSSTLHRLRILPALLILLATATVYAKGAEPPLRLLLSDFGFERPGKGALSAGAISTVAFLDKQHLLVTFAVHRLMKRLPEDPIDDLDHTIEAVVIHLPSGEVIASTEWRTHDSGQYLWSLGHGRFLLRIRNTLSVIAPLANLANHDPFLQQPLLDSKRMIAAIILSPDRDLLTVETVERQFPGSGFAESSSNQFANKRTQLNFYRLLWPAQPTDKVVLQAAGIATADEPIGISITSAGHLEISKESQDRWLFDFDPYAGKYLELSPFDTSCRPHGVFVSASEFIAFGCHGGDDLLTMGGFNLAGEEMWQQDFTDEYTLPSFAVAPTAGRFAISRNLAPAGMTSNFAPSSLTAQEIRVYQTYNGKELLRVNASPVQRIAGNYDLSSDGLKFAIIRNDAVELHSLPPLTMADEAAIRKAKTMEPPISSIAVNLAGHGKPNNPTIATTKPQLITPVISVNTQSSTVTLPDSVEQTPVTHRKRPTLYTLPTDKPQENPQ